MKIVHWTMYNASGMNSVAETMCRAERKLGLDSHCANAFEKSREFLLDNFRDADVHVSHTYFPEWFKRELTRSYKLVWLGHGTPEHVFYGSLEDGRDSKHGMNDGFMLFQYYLQHADALVTHWPRHAEIYRTLVDKGRTVHEVPMGIDLDFWKKVPAEKFPGTPSVLSAENGHTIKLPYDLFLAWPWVYPRIKSDISLHVTRLPMDLFRWFFPLVNRNGASFACHISSAMWDQVGLRQSLSAVDYYCGLVWKGDFNRISLEANACGCKTISYEGNPYSDFWVSEGDQRRIASQLVDIFSGKTVPRSKSSPVSCDVTAEQMKVIYETC